MQNNIQKPIPSKGNTTNFSRTESAPPNNEEFLKGQQIKEKIVKKEKKMMKTTVQEFKAMDFEAAATFADSVGISNPSSRKPSENINYVAPAFQPQPQIQTQVQQSEINFSQNQESLPKMTKKPRKKMLATAVKAAEFKPTTIVAETKKEGDVFDQLKPSNKNNNATEDVFGLLNQNKQSEEKKKQEDEIKQKEEQEKKQKQQQLDEQEQLKKEKADQEKIKADKEEVLANQKKQEAEKQRLEAEQKSKQQIIEKPEKITIEFIFKVLKNQQKGFTYLLTDQKDYLSRKITQRTLEIKKGGGAPLNSNSKYPQQQQNNTQKQYGNSDNSSNYNNNQKGNYNNNYRANKTTSMAKNPNMYAKNIKNEDPDEVKKRSQIKGSTGAWIENAKNDNQDAEKKICKDIRFNLQTLSPDNLEDRLERLIVFQKDDFSRTELINQLIEKGCDQFKYVTTFAKLIQEIILHQESVTEQSEGSKKPKNVFKITLISKIQSLFEGDVELLPKNKQFTEMNQEQIEKYQSKKRERIKRLVILIGELYKVKVLPFKVIQISMTLLLNNYLNLLLEPYTRTDKNGKPLEAKKLAKDMTEEEKLEEKYKSNDNLEALIEFIDNVGKEIEEYEKKKNNDKITEKEKEISKQVQDFVLKKKMGAYQKNFLHDEEFTLDFLFEILNFFGGDNNLLEPRMCALIKNLDQRRSENWKTMQAKKGTNAVSLNEVKETHQAAKEQSERSAMEYEQNNRRGNYGNNNYGNNNYGNNNYGNNNGKYGNNNNNKNYQNPTLGKKPSFRQKDSQQSQQSNKLSKEDLIKMIEDDKRQTDKDFQKFQQDFEKDFKAIVEKEVTEDFVNKTVEKSTGFLEIDVIPLLFKQSCIGSEAQAQKRTESIISILNAYLKNKKTEVLSAILNQILIVASMESTDFPFMISSYATIFNNLRENKLFKVTDLVFKSTGDEDEDEEYIYLFQSFFEALGKEVIKKETELTQYSEELKQFYSNLKLKCEVEENECEMILTKIKA